MTNEVINVEGMSCDHCKHSIEKALNGLDGVTSSEVSLANGNVEVEFDENQVAFNDFKEAIALADKILRQDEPKHYPFETLAEISRTFEATGHRLDAKQRKQIGGKLDELRNYAHKRIGVIPNGYQRDKAQSALNGIDGPIAAGRD